MSGITAEQKLAEFYYHLFDGGFFVFSETHPYFRENILQILWNEQATRPEGWRLLSGEHITVTYPGLWNREAGPDFLGAHITLDNGVSLCGDVEIHHDAGNWFHHGHQNDPRYSRCILHVVWQADSKACDAPPGNIPILELRNQQNLNLDEVVLQYKVRGYSANQEIPPAEIARELGRLNDDQLYDLLCNCGWSRLFQKAHRHAREIARLGLDEWAYHAIADALGYKNNREQFAMLVEQVPLSILRSHEDSQWAMAMLLGAARLLPDPTRDTILAEWREFVKQSWHLWGPHQMDYREIHWNLNQRPLNAPLRRVFALAILLQRTHYQPGHFFLDLLAQGKSERERLKALREALIVQDEAWNRLYSFERELKQPAALLGESRANDIIINVIVPLYLGWSILNQRTRLCFDVRNLIMKLGRLQENRRFYHAALQLIIPPSRRRTVARNAIAQQGLLHLAALSGVQS
ncbi:MAG: DUF2851 family protein [Lentisphaerae bacterium]|nr:MAG: DUF2851 family protein [Lentisphaerota bacterium]